jgi:hypothetical protein
MSIFAPILVITRPKKHGIGTHWGVHFPNGYVYDYLHNVGLRVCTPEEFADGLKVTVVREIPWHMALSVRARLDELSQNPRKYDLLSWNCETFAEWLTSGVPKSAQVVATLLLVGVTALLVVVAK